MKRFNTTLLLCAMLVSCAFPLASCGQSEKPSDTVAADTTDNVSESESETSGYRESDPVDYGGKTVTIWYNQGDGFEPNQDVAASELNGETLNDAVFNRNQRIQDKYNIVLETSYPSDLSGSVKKSVNAADGAVDIVLDHPRNIFPMGLEGFYMNLNDIPNVNYEEPWWDGTIKSDTEVNGVNFFAISSMNIHAYGATPVTVFNKKLAADYVTDDLYEVMEKGKWTMDYLMNIAKTVITDLDGDGQYTLADRYGYLANNFSVDCLIGGTGYKFVSTGDDGRLEANLVSEKLYNIYDKIRRLTLIDNGAYLSDRYLGKHADEEIEVAFENNQALFWVTNLKGVQRRRNMPGDFGVLPMPKLNESQDKYYAHLQLGVGDSIAVPVTCQDADMIGRILEDFAYFSHSTVIPAFYEVTVVGKSMRDEGSAKTLDVLLNNYYYDIGGLQGIVSEFRSPVTSNKEEIVSWLESKSKSFSKAIDKYNNYFFEKK